MNTFDLRNQMYCPKCKAPFEAGEAQCPECHFDLTSLNNAQNPYSSPLQQDQPQYPNASTSSEGDATGGLIPYKNPKALIAYYLGIASGLPLIGLPLGMTAFVLGILGLKDRKKNPVIKGSAHAWVGIGCGGLFTLLWGALIVSMLIGLLAASR
ncbi:MAG: hypothetical protein R3C03_15545 [Pirellulaceae bacterium]